MHAYFTIGIAAMLLLLALLKLDMAETAEQAALQSSSSSNKLLPFVAENKMSSMTSKHKEELTCGSRFRDRF
jgi:hypothetical protein